MRKIAFFLAMLVATAFAVPAQAQGVNLDRVLGVLGGATAYGYNSCSYVNGGVQQASCQANRALNVVNTLRQNEQAARYRQQERFQRRTQQLSALQRACQAGDTESCARSGGTDGRQMEIARALMEACTAGDRRSCARADAMMDERNITASYRDDRGYEARARYDDRRYETRRTDAYAQQGCRPSIDPRTGYRIAGTPICR